MTEHTCSCLINLGGGGGSEWVMLNLSKPQQGILDKIKGQILFISSVLPVSFAHLLKSLKARS